MSTTTTTDLAEQVIATLRAHEAELRGAGIRRLSLFGSVARWDAQPTALPTSSKMPKGWRAT